MYCIHVGTRLGWTKPDSTVHDIHPEISPRSAPHEREEEGDAPGNRTLDLTAAMLGPQLHSTH